MNAINTQSAQAPALTDLATEIWATAQTPPGTGFSVSIDRIVELLAPTFHDAQRYEWLRSRPLNTIARGGVFAGLTPDNVVLNGDDLDAAIDRARGAGEKGARL